MTALGSALAKERRDARAIRLRTIEAVCDLMQSAGSFAPERDAIVPHSNGYACWFIPYAEQPLGTAPISAEEILRRIEAREALANEVSAPGTGADQRDGDSR